jgi:hypothetical protein
MNIKVIFFIAAAALSLPVSAGFVDTDVSVVGDKKATLHEETGLEWLKLDNTVGMSIDDVSSAIQAGGILSGWRFALETEVSFMVDTLLGNVPFNGRQNVMLSNAFTNDSENFIFKMGLSNYLTFGGGVDRAYSKGAYLNDAGERIMSGTVRERRYAKMTTMYFYDGLENASYNTSYSDSTTGVFLVSDGGLTLSSRNDPSLNINNSNAPINVSVPLSMAGFGLLSLFCLRRKK